MDGTAGDDVDRISALPDDLLHVILTHLRTALDVTRTDALSRRWRRVWVHARDLSLADLEFYEKGASPDDFAGFVDWVLAQRGDADMYSLQIAMKLSSDHPPPDKINEWIRYAAQRVAGDFDLRIPVRSDPCQTPIKLPGHGRASSISLHLLFHGLQFPPPAAARYEALASLTLRVVSFAADRDGRALRDFVSSSSCPRLRTLVMEPVWELTQLVLRVEALQELRVLAPALLTLDVAAPNLRVFDLVFYNRFAAARIVVLAPRLQEIGMRTISFSTTPSPSTVRPDLDIHGLTSVRCLLGTIRLVIHAHHCSSFDTNKDVNFWLLKNCPGVDDVKVCLRHAADEYATADDFVDLTSEGAARFPNVRRMFLEAVHIPVRHLVPSISSLLLRFPRLRSLCIKITNTDRGVSRCFCHQLGMCYDHRKNSLEFLEKVEVSGFTGAGEEMDLVTLIFQISPSIRSVTLYANSEMPHGDDYLELMHHKLMDICSSDHRGNWEFGKGVCTWGVLHNREHIVNICWRQTMMYI